MRFFSTMMSLTVAEFAAKPFIKQTYRSPMAPKAVLSFFFGEDFGLNNANVSEIEIPSAAKQAMQEGRPLATMTDIWYGGGAEYDGLCSHFVPTVRAVGKQDFPDDTHDQWTKSIDGVMAQVICCDQLSRNCFRGTEEAFAYEDVCLRLVRQVVDETLKSTENDNKDMVRLTGEVYPPYASFLITSLMHSEDPSNLKMASDVLTMYMERFQDNKVVADFLTLQEGMLTDHRDVVKRFGRYPHRNAKVGRENTPEEQAWLDDVDNLPGWAKSQG